MLKEKFKNDELDIIIDNAIGFDEENNYTTLFRENILIGIPKDNEFNKKNESYILNSSDLLHNKNKRIDIHLLEKESFILLKDGNSMREIAENIFSESNIQPSVAFEFDQLMTAVCYSESGLGVCFLTDTVAKANPSSLSLYLPDTKYSSREVYLIQKKNRYISNATKEFIRFTKNYINEFFS